MEINMQMITHHTRCVGQTSWWSHTHIIPIIDNNNKHSVYPLSTLSRAERTCYCSNSTHSCQASSFSAKLERQMLAISRSSHGHLSGSNQRVRDCAVTYHTVCVVFVLLLLSCVLSAALCNSVQTFVNCIVGSTSESVKMQSFVDVAESSDFTIHNLPYGIFSTEANVRDKTCRASCSDNILNY